MKFREWLILNEKAERTAAKIPLYPDLYHTKQYSDLYHVVSSPDYGVYVNAKLKPFRYLNFEKTKA